MGGGAPKTGFASVVSEGDPMEIQILRDFIVLTECRNFTRAAEKLHLTQPTLSKHIAAMEKELGCTLLDRSRRMVELTKEGELLAAAAIQIVEAFDYCQTRISKLVEQRPIRVAGILYDNAVSAITSIATSLLETKNTPPVIYTSVAQEFDFLQQLLDDNADISISYVTSEQIEEFELERVPLTRTRFVAMLNNTNPLGQLKEMSIDQLRNTRFIKFADNYSICGWNIIEKVCNDHGFEPRTRTVLGKNTSNYTNTEVGADEVVILPNNLPQLRYLSDYSQVALVPLIDDDSIFRLYAIYKKSSTALVAPIIDALNQARKIIINHGKNSMLVNRD